MLRCKKANSYSVFHKHDVVAMQNIRGLISGGLNYALDMFKVTKHGGIVAENVLSDLRVLMLERSYFEYVPDDNFGSVLATLLRIFPSLKKIVIYNKESGEETDSLIKAKRGVKLGAKVYKLSAC